MFPFAENEARTSDVERFGHSIAFSVKAECEYCIVLYRELYRDIENCIECCIENYTRYSPISAS